ncbi:hypothetical protein [Mycoplasma crocodyli]|uniref:Transmembrane protein n=1 Tax=Mycoplasma crocodyli (strain ATCC 51981 / MP145) TaxID=512564 RepID=D5E5J1_MYCCM|nr:hypothetical protein [Mycoplasma crocodyli]ADE19780.1 hypothetical protein MCRO_0402 [Mycoplasma crocodyli MP145]
MKEKLYKYLKMLIVALLAMNLIGLFFVYTGQFAENKKILDFLVSSYAKSRTTLSWIGLVFLVAGWITWEFAISKNGNKILGIISIALFVVQLCLTINLLSIISLTLSFAAMSSIIVLMLSRKNSKKLVDNIAENSKDNKDNNDKLKKLLKK